MGMETRIRMIKKESGDLKVEVRRMKVNVMTPRCHHGVKMGIQGENEES